MEFTDAPIEPFGETILDMAVPTQLSLKMPLVFRMVKELKGQACLPRTGAHRAELAFDEAITNAMVHGNRLDPSKKVRVMLFADSERWGAVIEDEGEGFTAADIPDPNAAEFILREAGRGILLMEGYVDELKYSRKGNRLFMARRRQAMPDEKGAEAREPAAAGSASVAAGPASRTQEEGVEVVQVLSDRVDDENAAAVRDVVMSVIGEGRPVLVDLARVTYISSAGLGILVTLYKHALSRKARVVLASVQPAVVDILRSARLLQLFEGLQVYISADRSAALRELKKRG